MSSKFQVTGPRPSALGPYFPIRNPQSAIRNLEVRNPQLPGGFSLLDLLIALLVLTVVLLAAAKQFGAYTHPVVQPAPQTESTPAQP